jgi:ABC-type antimicrobial peptide transport system permease subunit
MNNKLYSVINMVSLTIGFSCLIMIFLWVEDELSFGKFGDNVEDIYQLTITHENGVLDPNVPYFLPYAMAEMYPEIKNYTRIYRLGAITNCVFNYQEPGEEPVMFYEESVIMVDTGFFSIFPFSFVYGSPKTALLNRNGVILRSQVAEKYFGDSDPVGKILLFNNQLSLTVTGVVDVPPQSIQQPDFILPLRGNLSTNYNWRDPSYILLHGSISIETFKHKIAGSFMDLYPHPLPGELVLGVLPISKSYLSFGKSKYIYIFIAVALFILLVGCINFIILTTGRSTRRIMEVGIRKVAGAQRGQLIVYLLTESVIIAFLSLLFSIILLEITLPAFGRFFDKSLSVGYFDRPQIIPVFFLVSALVGGLAGIIPAISFTRRSPIIALQIMHHVRTGKSTFMIGSIITQFTISFFLLTCTFLIIKQLSYMMKQPLGFNIENIIEIPMNASLEAHFESYKQNLERNPNIVSITAGQAVPFNEDYKTGLDWEGKSPDQVPVVRYSIIRPDYLETFEMEVIEGRSFSKDYVTDASNYVINEKAIQLLNVDDPLGKKITFWGRQGEIIGVVKNFHHVSLHREILPHVFTINPENYGNLNHVFIKLRPGNIQETLHEIESVTEAFAPGFPFKYNFIDSGVGKLYTVEKKLGIIITWFAFLSVFITLLGVFSLSTFLAERRTKEFGIRKVHGARTIHLLYHLNIDLIKWIGVSFVASVPLAYFAMQRWLQNFAFKVTVEAWIFLLACFIILIISVLTSSGVTLKSAFRNPVDSLRYE